MTSILSGAKQPASYDGLCAEKNELSAQILLGNPAIGNLAKGFLAFRSAAYRLCEPHKPEYLSSHHGTHHHHEAVVDAHENVLTADFHTHAPPSCMHSLTQHGQHPEAFVIGCDDSRATVEMILQGSPGRYFVQSGIGAIVPPRSKTDWLIGKTLPKLAPLLDVFNGSAHMASALQYATEALGVQNIFHIGHTACGGLRGLAEGNTTDHVKLCVERAAPYLSSARKRFNPASKNDLFAAVEMENVIQSVHEIGRRIDERQRRYPERFTQGKPEVYGFLFDMHRGTMHMLIDPQNGVFAPIAPHPVLHANAPSIECTKSHVCSPARPSHGQHGHSDVVIPVKRIQTQQNTLC